MTITLPQELEDIRRLVREFVEKKVRPREKEIEQNDAIPEDLLQEAKELGLFGLGIPEQYGGLGLGVLGRAVVYEELGRGSGALSSVIGVHTSIGTGAIVEAGSEELKRRYLPSMATGERIACFALTEPDAGSDAARIKTTARRSGDHWLITGQKVFITNAPIADIFTVFAVTDPERGARGISAFVVERDFPGIEVGPPQPTMGLRGAHVAAVYFDNCRVPAGNLLGQEGEGYVTALKILTKARVTLAARCVGAMERILEESVTFAKQRVTMGKPIAEHQLIQAYLAEMATDIAASRTLTYHVAALADAGHRIIKEAAMAKLFVTEALGRVADKGVQIHGGLGYMRDTPVERLYRDARVTRIYEGTSEIQKLIISSQLLKEYD